MKLPLAVLAGTFVLASSPRLSAQPAAPAFSQEQILQAWGWRDACNEALDHVEVSPAECPLFLRGMERAFQGLPMPYGDDYHVVDPDVRRLALARRADHVLAVTNEHEAEAARFFAALKKDPAVVTLPCGISYRILKPGHGPLPRENQTVNVHYTGRQIDGSEFIQFGPLDWTLVPGHAHSPCRGWYEGLRQMGAGGTIELYVPPPLPPKEADLMGIPPGSAMIFDVDVISLRDATPDELYIAKLPPAPDPPEDPPSGLTQAQIMESWGYFSGRQSGFNHNALSDAERDLYLEGFVQAMRGYRLDFDMRGIDPAIDAFAQARQKRAWQTLCRHRLAVSEAFFAQLRNKPGVVALSDGLCYEITRPGSGVFPRAGQRVVVNYVGHLLEGGEFDHNSDEPVGFTLGGAALGTGWDEGMQKVRKGGHIRIYVPPALGYGEEDITGVPADSTLIFDVDLIDVTPPHAAGGK